MQTKLQATVENLEAKELLPELKRSPGSAGKIGGRANLSTHGNSVSDMAATASGELALIMSQGRASTLTLVLTNLDLANAVKYVMFGDPNASVHCGVLDARLENGRATPQLFVVDSSEERINGEGNVDFKTEQYDVRLVADSKRASLVALRGPIRIGGTFKDPKVMPEVGPIAARVGAAVALGVLATPLAALIALVDPGDAKSANCAALVEQAKQSVQSSPVAPDSTASGRPAAAQSPSKERGTDARPNATSTTVRPEVWAGGRCRQHCSRTACHRPPGGREATTTQRSSLLSLDDSLHRPDQRSHTASTQTRHRSS